MSYGAPIVPKLTFGYFKKLKSFNIKHETVSISGSLRVIRFCRLKFSAENILR